MKNQKLLTSLRLSIITIPANCRTSYVRSLTRTLVPKDGYTPSERIS